MRYRIARFSPKHTPVIYTRESMPCSLATDVFVTLMLIRLARVLTAHEQRSVPETFFFPGVCICEIIWKKTTVWKVMFTAASPPHPPPSSFLLHHLLLLPLMFTSLLESFYIEQPWPLPLTCHPGGRVCKEAVCIHPSSPGLLRWME